jgi:hypothetical protein
MMIITGLAVETDHGIGGTDSPIGTDPQTGGDIGAESVIIETGERTPMTGLEDAAGILLTLGPVAEAKIVVGKLQLEPKR